MSWARLIAEMFLLSFVTGLIWTVIYALVFVGTKFTWTANISELILFFIAAHVYLYGLGRRDIILRKFGIEEKDKENEI